MYYILEQRERAEQTENGGDVTEYKERKDSAETLLWNWCLTSCDSKLKVKIHVDAKEKVKLTYDKIKVGKMK